MEILTNENDIKPFVAKEKKATTVVCKRTENLLKQICRCVSKQGIISHKDSSFDSASIAESIKKSMTGNTKKIKTRKVGEIL